MDVKILKSQAGVSENKWTIQFTNNTEKIAFFVRPQLMTNDEEVMPSYWTANYFTLAPHESTTASVTAPTDKLGKNDLSLLIEGWNLTKQTISLSLK